MILASGGCSFAPRATNQQSDGNPSDVRNHDGKEQDARVYSDALLDAKSGCDGAGSFVVCPMTPPSTSITLDVQTIDTGMCKFNGGVTGQIYDPGNGNPHLCVIAGTSVAIVGSVRGEGPNPLVIVATSGDLVMTGGIDVASHDGQPPGAGANYPGCATANINGMDGMYGGGGAGGTSGSKGGDGGGGNGASGGSAHSVTAAPTFVRGGCGGGKGGNGMSSNGTNGGDGGGAVYLISEMSMTIGGPIDASGGGGNAPTSSGSNGKSGGAGGGGSGGMIVLYAADALVQTGDIYANGGGGAGASSNTTGNAGSESSGPTSTGAGGTGNASGGAGGTSTLQGTMGGTNPSGGGGGGGVGVVKVVSNQPLNSNVSPPET